MHPNGVPCRKWGVKCSNDREKYGRKATCHPERNASGVEGSSDSVKMRCERILAFWAFPCPRARSGYIARPPVRTYGTPAQLLRRPFGRIALKKVPELAEGPPHRGHYP